MKISLAAAWLILLCVQSVRAENLLIYREQTVSRVARVEVSERQEGKSLLLWKYSRRHVLHRAPGR
jgi:hypothetical protein